MREIKFRAWDKEYKRMVYDFPLVSHGEFNVFDFTFLENFTTGFFPMQYTGLKDKNGREIYEGDICETPDGNKSVGWGLEGWEFKQTLKSSAEYIQPNLCYWGTPKIKVIGNVHENPELLK